MDVDKRQPRIKQIQLVVMCRKLQTKSFLSDTRYDILRLGGEEDD